jgi:transcriptional regulator with XRE-family HTH domain
MDDTTRRTELKEFLRVRREALSPEAVGLTGGRRRRVRGLRREEVAAAAGVGLSWYTWLEQGRAINVSRQALRRIAHALRMTATDEAYFLRLASADPIPSPTTRVGAIEPYMQQVLDAMGSVPAYLVGPCIDVVAFNRLADIVYDLSGADGTLAANDAWRLFMDSRRRAMYGDQWEKLALRTVGVLRSRHATLLGDPQFAALLKGLRAASAEFERFWNSGCTAALDTVEVALRHRRLGALQVAIVRLSLPLEPDCFVSVHPPANARTAAVFARLARIPAAGASITAQ